MKQVVHRFVLLVCAAMLVCMMLPVGVNAISANYCEAFEKQVDSFARVISYFDTDKAEGIVQYTIGNIPNLNKYEVESGDMWSKYSVSADVFEKWANTFFEVKENLRQVKTYYNAKTNTYDWQVGASGGGVAQELVGYVENTDKTYTVYLKQYDDVVPDNLRYIYKITIRFDGTYAKYLNWTKVDEISNVNNMITPDMKVDTPTTKPPVTNPPTSKPTASQNTKTPSSATTSKPVPTNESSETSTTSTAPAPTESVSQPSLIDTDTHISITGNVPDNATLSVKPISETEDTYTTIKEKLPEQVSRFQSYDINLLDSENATIQPDGSVQISIPKPEGFGDSLAVYRTEADGSMPLLDSEVKDGHVVFTTEHFSLYTIAELADVPVIAPPSSGIPIGGIVAIVIGVLVLVGGGVTAGILLYKKKKGDPSDLA